MTKVKQYKVTCNSCGHQFPALYMFSTNSFMPKSSEEEKQKRKEFWEKNGVCPKCGIRNEVTSNLPEWEKF